MLTGSFGEDRGAVGSIQRTVHRHVSTMRMKSVRLDLSWKIMG